ncbi:terminase [Microbacterium sp. 2FI]|uniref:terminase n=1 Tax=Microbacterium sp. 2FI TaxID=2502193 RepID=UPI0010F9A0ED|nr:terminase [Microbacterium sp. 2FI]
MIEFALLVLGIELYPWQKWLLIHALELNEDGTYRFRKIFILVGRQNGKTTLLTVLTLWWLFMDAESFPDHLPAHEFLILGTAQNLDLAEEAWDAALKRCDPFPDEDDAQFVIDDLARETRRPVKKNGSKALRLRNGARYEPRAATRMGGRGKSAARVVMDEMREQQTWDVWGSVSKTKNAIFNSQLWGISSAGDAKSVVLSTLRKGALKTIEEFERYVESGVQTLEDFANGHDMATAIFEWSADPKAKLLDIDGILQANPSVGYKPMFFESIWSDLLGDEPEATKRTEILCQWVDSMVDPYIDGPSWEGVADGPELDNRGRLVSIGSEIPDGAHMVLGVDTSWNRSMSYISVAGVREDGAIHLEVVRMRAGMLWVVAEAVKIAERNGITHVVVQARGCPASDFIKEFKERTDLEVVELGGTTMLNSAGRLKDRTRDRLVRHRAQPILNMAIAGGVTKKLAGLDVWDREASIVDVAPAVSVTNALYGVETVLPTEPVVSAYEDHELLVV